MQLNLQVSDPRARDFHSRGRCFISHLICWSTETKQRKVCFCPNSYGLHCMCKVGQERWKSRAGEDGWCEVMNRTEFSSVWVIMGGEVVGKQPSCVNNEGGTLWRGEPSPGKLNYQVTAAHKWNGKFKIAFTFREAGVTPRIPVNSVTWKQRTNSTKGTRLKPPLLTLGR